MKREHKEEASTAAILRAWDAAPDVFTGSALSSIMLHLTEALQARGLAAGGKLTPAARNLLRRVDARARAAAKLARLGAS